MALIAPPVPMMAVKRQDGKLCNIPVIMFGDTLETIDTIQASSFGVIDYVSKPFIPVEICRRINTHLALHFAKQELQDYTNRLEYLVIQRTRDLEKAYEQLKILDNTKIEFLDVIAHELKTPATSVLAIGQLAINSLGDAAEQNELRAIFERGSRRLQRTIDNALLLVRLQRTDANIMSEKLEFSELLERAIHNAAELAVEGGVGISRPENSRFQVVGNYQLTEQCLTTMLNVAIKMASKGTSIIVECNQDTGYVNLHLAAWGRSFDEETLASLFDTFSPGRIASRVEELGFSIPLSAQIAMLYGGKVQVTNAMDAKGILIRLSLKRFTGNS